MKYTSFIPPPPKIQEMLMNRFLMVSVLLFMWTLSVNAEKPKAEPIAGPDAGMRMVKTADGIEYAFRWCPAGSFTMGSPESESGRCPDEFPHEVALTDGFWMLETEVTREMWKSVMGNEPGVFRGERLPVEQVGWVDCIEFCRKLSEKLGSPVTLPTEAQWEYACRAGTSGPFAGNLEEMAWFGPNSENRTHPVGQKKPNAWGIHDMHGNVWEWCLDWYAEDSYAGSPSTDPHGPDRGVNRVYRGGGWYGDARFCRSAYRNYYAPNFRSYGHGFRIILK